jgi:hypothetical protein
MLTRIILARQARDKHRESTQKKDDAFFADGWAKSQTAVEDCLVLLSADEAEIEAEIEAADADAADAAQYVVDDRTDGAAYSDSVDRADAAGAADGTRNVATATPAAPTAALSTMRVTTLIPPALEHPGAGAMTVDGAAKKTPSFALHFSHSNDHLPSQARDGSTKNTWF